MRALWLTSSYPRYAGDYAGIFLHRWARGLAALGVDVRVIAPGWKDAPARERLDGVEVIRFPYVWPRRLERLAYGDAGLMVGIGRDRGAAAQLVPFAASMVWHALGMAGGTDVIHAFWTPMGALALAAGALRRKPVILSPLGTDLRALPEVFNRAVIRGARAVVAGGGPCTEVHDRLAGMTGKTLHRIFLPLDEAELNAGDGDAFRREFGIKDERVVTFIARMYELKDPWTMLDAAVALVERRPATKVVFVGDGPLLLSLREGAKSRGLARHAIFTGARSDIGSILKASDVFVSLNLVDNCWATTIAEAMFLGVPCVISDGGPEVPGEAGAEQLSRERKLFPHGEAAWLVPQRDPQALARALDRILGHAELADHLAAGGRALLEGHRRRDALIFEDTVKLYESVIHG
jgi:glycosyltransferase involved in cell wall biosynthesis